MGGVKNEKNRALRDAIGRRTLGEGVVTAHIKKKEG
jgi:hypothetical protein